MLKRGDKVAVLDDELEGIVTSSEGGLIQMETTEGFILEFEERELVKIEASQDILPEDYDSFSEVIKEKESFKKPMSRRIKPKERNAPPMEVDLHVDKLVNSYKSMGSYDILTLQLDTARRQLEFAINKRIQRIVFIHGVGEGVLKAELDFLFGRYDNIRFYDADYSKYGLGATEVYILQKV